MPSIDTDLIREVIRTLNADSDVVAFVSKDSKGYCNIRPANFNPTNYKSPYISVETSIGESEPIIPAERQTLNITVWFDRIETNKVLPYEFLTGCCKIIKDIFNRQGSAFNRIDIPTNTGIRVCHILKISEECDYDEEIKKYYGELIFDIVVSEGESFIASDAGDIPWV